VGGSIHCRSDPAWVAFLVRRRTSFLALVPVLLILVARPSLPLFVTGCLLALFGEAIRVWAAGTIHKTKHVTTGGPYAHVRHPLYFGSFFVALGYCFMSGSTLSFLILIPLFFLFHGAAVWMEERTLRQVFGQEYAQYMRQVGRALPRLRAPRDRRGSFQWSQVTWNHEHVHASLTLLMAAVFALRLYLGR
jgi:protein-S-isoprenylcysteine O-methyltransferase Ste14